MQTKVCIVKAIIFPVVMYGCKSWTIKKAKHWRIDALNCAVGEDSWESLDYKEIKAVNSKGSQSWLFIGRTDAEAEAPILWPPDLKSWLTGKDPDAGKNWKQKEKGTTEDEMVRYSITDSMNVNLSTLREIMKDREAWRAGVHGVTKSQTRLNDWTTIEV